MTTIPFENPTTRSEARHNAIYFAKEAAANMQTGGIARRVPYFLNASQAWSAIAETFPEIEYVQLMANDQPVQTYTDPLHNESGPELEPWAGGGPDDATEVMQLPSTGHVQPSGRPEGTDGTITVDAVAWDVLRALAIRYVLTSMARSAEIDLTDEGSTGIHVWDLRLVRLPGSEVVQAYVERIES